MKKMKTVLTGILFTLLMAMNLYAFDAITELTIPNSTSQSLGLPVGLPYATVEQTDIACPGSLTGVRMVVTPNQSILVPVPTGGSYGVQEFGFNYLNTNSDCMGDHSDLTINGPTQWQIKYDQNLSDFGVFLVDDSGKGSNRQDPLTIDICADCGNLTPANFLVTNTAGYVFAVHIAPFTYGDPPLTLSSSFFATQNQTLIELSYFTATVKHKKIMIKWKTESETDNAGFNLKRAESESGEYVQINSSLIPAKGSDTEGSTYVYNDRDIQAGKTYYYILEDVELDGDINSNGPILATPKKVK